MVGLIEEQWAPEQLWHHSLASFPPSGFLWSGLSSCCISPSCFLPFLSLSVQKALMAYLSARPPAGLHRLSRHFQPIRWHNYHLLQHKGLLRSQGPPTLQQLKWPAFFCWRSAFAFAMQLVTGCSARNWKIKNKNKLFWSATFKEVFFLVKTLQNREA